MIEGLLIAWVTVIGVVILIPLGRKLSTWGLVLLGPTVGTAVYAISSLVLVSLQSFSVIRAMSLASAGAAAIVVLWWVRAKPARPPLSHPMGAVLIAGGLAGSLSLVLQVLPLTRVSFDSFWYIMSAGGLEGFGTMDGVPFSFGEILKRQLVVPAIEAAGSLTGRGYVISWIPVVGISALTSCAWLGLRGMAFFGTAKTWRLVIVVVSVAFVVTTNQFVFHLFYINGHMVFAAFLLVGVGLTWHATALREPSLTIPAGIVLAALVPLRAEAVIVIFVFLVPVLVSDGTSRAMRWALAAPVFMVTLLWYLVGIRGSLPVSEVLADTTVLGNILLAGSLIGLVAISNQAWIPRGFQLVQWVPLWAMVAALGWQMLTGFDELRASVAALGVNIASEGGWSSFWWLVPLLVFGGAIAVRFSYQRFFLLPMVSFGFALPVFAYLRGDAYRFGFGDSGNRMLMHVVLVVMLYLMLAAGAAESTSAKTSSMA